MIGGELYLFIDVNFFKLISFQLFEFAAGLIAKDQTGNQSHIVTVIPPCSGALYTRKLQLTMYW